MHGLEKGIHQLALYETNTGKRQQATGLLSGIIGDINSGIEIWKQYLESGNKSAGAGAFGGWADFSIERKLFDVELDARNKASDATDGASSLDEPLVELAYKKLNDGENPEAAARAAIERMEAKITRLGELIDQIKTTKPKKGGASKASGQSGSAKKSKTKAKGKKAKKPAAKAKSTKKKSAKKKAAKKKSPAKKKAAKKKAVKKKPAAKKKATKKKTAKKKAAKKKSAAKKKATKKKAAKKKTKRK